ncbi:hypothetical protein DHD05_00995 [Arenibacter sp. N53]|uniref:hypothetical protein n=1 Tax=Arenibacter TaxID=178469 RepID=UPI000CD44EF8|nr:MULTISPECIES: hypothetical protein [Arenibacter]MCM4150152.1 hypothetical protein [Arenibacter sp. N53]
MNSVELVVYYAVDGVRKLFLAFGDSMGGYLICVEVKQLLLQLDFKGLLNLQYLSARAIEILIFSFR